MPKFSKILVTGGAGFIGSHLVDAYLEAGHRVVVLDNLSSGEAENINSKVTAFYHQDINSDLDAVFKKEKFDLVCHHAAQPLVGPSVTDPISDAEINILGQIRLLQACVKFKVKKIVFSSSGGAVYGDGAVLPVKETAPLNPISPYGISKASAERYIQFFASEYGLDYTILRYANVFGPRDHFNSGHVITVFTHLLLRNKVPVIDWDGEQSKDYVYVSDVVEINKKILTAGKNQIYNVGFGKGVSVNEIYQKFLKVLGKDIKPTSGPKRPGDVRLFYLDSSKARNELDWEPRVRIEDGIAKTIEWFRGKLG